MLCPISLALALFPFEQEKRVFNVAITEISARKILLVANCRPSQLVGVLQLVMLKIHQAN